MITLLRRVVLGQSLCRPAIYRAAAPQSCLSPRRLASSVSPVITLSNLKPAKGSTKNKKRVGRGIGSGGRTCGRGNSGQKSRSGHGIPRAFEGGQTPYHLRQPKRGAFNPHALDLQIVNLDRIQHLINTGRIDPTKPIDIRAFYDAGIRDIHDGVHIMARNSEFFKSKVVIMATKFTPSAIKAIERRGGHAISVYHTAEGIMHIRRPHTTRVHPSLPQYQPKFMPPMSYKKRLYYSSWENRGYLHPACRAIIQKVDPTFEQRYIMVEPQQPVIKPIFNFRNIPKEVAEETIPQ